MKENKNENKNWKGQYMPLDKKSNEDFNGQHPNHDENGLIDPGVIRKDKVKKDKKSFLKKYK